MDISPFFNLILNNIAHIQHIPAFHCSLVSKCVSIQFFEEHLSVHQIGFTKQSFLNDDVINAIKNKTK